jgi:hypothetical protein
MFIILANTGHTPVPTKLTVGTVVLSTCQDRTGLQLAETLTLLGDEALIVRS